MGESDTFEKICDAFMSLVALGPWIIRGAVVVLVVVGIITVALIVRFFQLRTRHDGRFQMRCNHCPLQTYRRNPVGTPECEEGRPCCEACAHQLVT